VKRSTQIGLAAVGVVLVASIWSRPDEETQDSLVYNSLSDCRAGGQLSAQQCETAFSEAAAARLKDAPKFNSQNECEAQYGANGCSSASIGAQAQPLLPPTAATCPPGSPQPECQQPRASSSSSSSSYGGSSSGGGRARAYSTTTGRGFTVSPSATRGVSSTTRVSSRGGFGSIARSFSSHSSS